MATAATSESSRGETIRGGATGRRPLRIGMVHYSDFEVDSRIQRQARALAERGDTVECVCLSDDAAFPIGPGEIAVHQAARGKPRGGARAYVEGNLRFGLGAARKLTALDRRAPFDLIEIHNMPDALVFAAMLPKLRRTPIVLNFHDTFPELFGTLFDRPPDHPLVRLVRAEERASAAFVDGHVFVTEEARELLRRRGIEAPRTQIVMNTPDERVFGARREVRKPPGDGPLRVIYHGGLAERFGAETLVRAVAGLRAEGRPIELDVYGSDAEAAARLAALAAPLAAEGIRIAPQPTPVEQIPSRLEAAHVGVVPTLRDDFTELLLPVKLLEYVHMGMPAIASRLPTIERYFGDDFLPAEPGDPGSIAAAIEAVRADPDAAAARASRASARLARIEWSRQRRGYLEMIDDLVGARRS